MRSDPEPDKGIAVPARRGAIRTPNFDGPNRSFGFEPERCVEWVLLKQPVLLARELLYGLWKISEEPMKLGIGERLH
jgi:hypothetical protein